MIEQVSGVGPIKESIYLVCVASTLTEKKKPLKNPLLRKGERKKPDLRTGTPLKTCSMFQTASSHTSSSSRIWSAHSRTSGRFFSYFSQGTALPETYSKELMHLSMSDALLWTCSKKLTPAY